MSLTAIILLLHLLAGCAPASYYDRSKYIEQCDDQNVLAKIASEDEFFQLRLEAINKITNQSLLEKFAQDKDPKIRVAAIENKNFTDQSNLRKIASDDKDFKVRVTAAKKFSDLDLFVKLIANKDTTDEFRLEALENINDQKILTRLAFNFRDNPVVLCSLIGKMNSSNIFLIQKSGDIKDVSNDPVKCIARIKLAIDEPRIKLHFNNIRCDVRVTASYRTYTNNSNKRLVYGEDISVDLMQDKERICSTVWSTDYPQNLTLLKNTNSKSIFWAPIVSPQDLIKELLSKSIFTRTDLEELLNSKFWEIRYAALCRLPDVNIAEKTLQNEKNEIVRSKAYQNFIANLLDSQKLADIALNYPNKETRMIAVKKIIDQDVLTKVARQDQDVFVRMAAIYELSDQATVSKIAKDFRETNPQVALAANIQLNCLPAKELEFTSTPVASSNKDHPFALELSIQTNTVADLLHLRIHCDGDIAEAWANNVQSEYRINDNIWSVYGYHVKLVKPIVLTLFSDRKINVLKVYDDHWTP